MGLSENRVTLNPQVHHHFPQENGHVGVYPSIRQTHTYEIYIYINTDSAYVHIYILWTHIYIYTYIYI